MQHDTHGRPGLGSTAARRLLLGAPGVGVFSRVTRLASLALRAPVATLGVADGGRLVLVGQTGVPDPWRSSGYIPLQATFCRHVLSAGDTFAVDDAARHLLGYSVARLDGFQRVAYCGSPLMVGGVAVAVLSVCDAQPRHWTSEDVNLMRDLTAAALRDLELLAERLGSSGALLGEPMPGSLSAVDSLAGGLGRDRPDDADITGGLAAGLAGDDADARQDPAGARQDPAGVAWPTRPMPAPPADCASRGGRPGTPAPGRATVRPPAAPPPALVAGPPMSPPAVPGAPSGGMPAAALPDGVLTLDADWRLTYVNDRARRLLRLGARDVAGEAFWELFTRLKGTPFQLECQRVAEDREPMELETYCDCASAWLEVRAWPLDEGGVALQLRDVSQRRSAQEALSSRESLYRRLFEKSRTPLFVMSPAGELLEVNSAFAELLGWTAEELAGQALADHALDGPAFERILDEFRDAGTVADADVGIRHGSGRDMICTISGVAQPGYGGTVYSAAMMDVTQQRRDQEQLVRSAFHDALTGLANRSVFMDRLERVLQHARRRPTGFAVVFLDLDNFKEINDTLGHLAGDGLLITVARRLEACVRQEDTVARMGGDEFAILLETINEVGDVTLVVDRIRESLAEPFTTSGRNVGTSASIGIAISVSDYENAEDLLRDADTAMYRAKSSGRNDYVIFDHDMHARILAQRQLETDLRGAVEDRRLALHYQPVVQLDTGNVTGLEALVRWPHPERGVLLPAEFIPMAEQTGLIVDLGWWVLREACGQLRAWQLECDDVDFSLSMSVNLSAKQFVHPDLLTKLDEVLAETGLDPSCLRLDLTESVVMENAEAAALLLPRIRERGVHICIDNFGTGFTSLRRLRELPISTLKIDRSFVQRLDEDGEGREIVQSIIALGRSMAIDAVAEGVETPEQLEQLRRLGTRFAQGFLFSLPLDHRAAGELLQETRVVD